MKVSTVGCVVSGKSHLAEQIAELNYEGMSENEKREMRRAVFYELTGKKARIRKMDKDTIKEENNLK